MANADGPDDWNASLKNNFALRAGILLISEVAVVSFVAVTVLLLVTTRNAVKHYRYYGGWGPEGSSLQPVSVLFLFAIFMDSIQAVGSILSARWAFDGQITEGSYCTAQAALKQIGNDGVAWFAIAIAVMTFLQTIFPGKLRRSQARRLAGGMIVFIFLFLLLMITIPATTIPHYYGNTGPWCWITDTTTEASRLKIGSEYAFYWLAAIVCAVLYGTIAVKWFREAGAERDRRLIRDAIAMGWYPIAYIIEILPQSIVRYLQWRPQGKRPQHGWMILSATLFASAGAINVLLWLLTGRRFGFSSLPHDDEEHVHGAYLAAMHSPADGSPHSVQPNFPDGSFVMHEAHLPSPYEWPPQEGGWRP